MRIALLSVPLAMLMACNVSGKAEADNVKPQAAGTREFALTGFDKVSLRGPDDVNIRVGPAASVHAQGDKAVLDRLEIEVVDGELRVKRQKGGWNWNGPNSVATITVTMPAISLASVAGSGDMTVDHVKTGSFTGAVSGSGDLKIGVIESDSVDLSIAGSGDISVTKGKAGKTNSSIAGSGSIDAGNLMSADVSASVAGSGDTTLGASRSASVSLIGSGDVTIGGGAKCSVKKVGSGDVNCG